MRATLATLLIGATLMAFSPEQLAKALLRVEPAAAQEPSARPAPPWTAEDPTAQALAQKPLSQGEIVSLYSQVLSGKLSRDDFHRITGTRLGETAPRTPPSPTKRDGTPWQPWEY